MSLLLNWRIWAALILAGGLAFSHFTAYRKGKQNVRDEWTVAVAEANADARKLETLRQSRVVEAQKVAAARDSALRADAVRARGELGSLRNDLDAAQRWASESRAAADEALRVAAELLGRCTALYLGVAEDAQRADSEARELRQAWPK
jgi:hypothetical protein